jgi:hypothetical protein
MPDRFQHGPGVIFHLTAGRSGQFLAGSGCGLRTAALVILAEKRRKKKAHGTLSVG